MTMWCHLPTILKRSSRLHFVVGAALFVAIITIIGVTFDQPVSAAGHTLGFRGNLQTKTGQPVPNDAYAIKFTIYQGGDGQTAGNPGGKVVWQEVYNGQSKPTSVAVKNGNFAVQLGSINSLDSIDWSAGNLWLSMNVAKPIDGCRTFTDANCQGDGEMLPMTRVSASPFALDSHRLGGKTANQFVQLGAGKQTDASDKASLYIDKTGPGNFMQLQSNGVDALALTAGGDIKFGTNSSQHTISIADNQDGAGVDLNIAAGNGTTGGSIHLSGGSSADGQSSGLVIIDTPTFSATTNDSSCLPDGQLATDDCQFTAASLNNTAVLIAGFESAGHTATVADPVIKTAGRTIFITADDRSAAFELNFLSSQQAVNVSSGQSVGLLWNGQSWTVISSQLSQPKVDQSEPAKPESNNTDKPAAALTKADTISLSQVSVADNAPTSEAPFGSIYYDTATNSLQCYEESGWGDCVAAPDKFVSLSPSYPNSIVRENGIGELTTDTCSTSLNINDGSDGQDAVCNDNQTYNYYQWKTDATTAQTRSIFVSYKMPPNFKSLVEDSLALTARADGPDSDVSLQVYRKQEDGQLKACGNAQTIRQYSKSNDWQIIQPESKSLQSCGIKPGDSIVIKIDLTTSLGSTSYVSDLDFMISSH